MNIREAKREDIPSIVKIASESFTSPWSEESIVREFDNTVSIFQVAEIDNEVVGFLILRVIQEEAEILSLAVKPDFRQKGIATELIRSAISRLKNSVKQCFLEVRVSNRAAIELYKKFNFKEIGIRKNYYRDPKEDAMVMTLKLY